MSKKKGIKKLYKNFEQFNQSMRETEGVIPEIFEKVAKKAAINFVNVAKDITEKEGLIDLGSYRRNWTGDVAKPAKKFWVVKGYNPINYASHLEYGHKLRNGKRWKGRFVGTQAIKTAEKYAVEQLTKELGSLFKP